MSTRPATRRPAAPYTLPIKQPPSSRSPLPIPLSLEVATMPRRRGATRSSLATPRYLPCCSPPASTSSPTVRVWQRPFDQQLDHCAGLPLESGGTIALLFQANRLDGDRGR